jgi:Enolase, C-terminal TIM barrel domain
MALMGSKERKPRATLTGRFVRGRRFTNPAIISAAISRGIANTSLIKLNQIGTVTETLEAMAICRQAGYRQFVSRPKIKSELSGTNAWLRAAGPLIRPEVSVQPLLTESRITTTGHFAWCTQCWPTEPSRASTNPP